MATVLSGVELAEYHANRLTGQLLFVCSKAPKEGSAPHVEGDSEWRSNGGTAASSHIHLDEMNKMNSGYVDINKEGHIYRYTYKHTDRHIKGF